MILSPLHISTEEMLGYLGTRADSLDTQWQEAVQSAIALCENNLQAQGMYKRLPIASITIKSDEPRIELGNSTLILTGSDITRHVRGAQELVLMACTLGLQSELFLKTQTAKNLSTGVLIDAAASALVEAAADQLQTIISEDLACEGLWIGSRFSPGYGDLALSTQKPLLDELNAQQLLGIHLTDNYLMVPSKSITAILGVYSDKDLAQHRSAQPTCVQCPTRNSCGFLRTGRKCYDAQ